jgi:hypothetical protein
VSNLIGVLIEEGLLAGAKKLFGNGGKSGRSVCPKHESGPALCPVLLLIGSLAFDREIHHVLHRDVDDAGDHFMLIGESDVGREFAIAGDEFFGAVDRIDDKTCFFLVSEKSSALLSSVNKHTPGTNDAALSGSSHRAFIGSGHGRIVAFDFDGKSRLVDFFDFLLGIESGFLHGG